MKKRHSKFDLERRRICSVYVWLHCPLVVRGNFGVKPQQTKKKFEHFFGDEAENICVNKTRRKLYTFMNSESAFLFLLLITKTFHELTFFHLLRFMDS